MYSQEPDNYTCPFCRMISNGLDNEKDVVFETDNVFVCLALHQHEGSGPSLLVTPKLHVENIYDISDALLSEISSTSKFIATKMRTVWDIQGVSIWQHFGSIMKKLGIRMFGTFILMSKEGLIMMASMGQSL